MGSSTRLSVLCLSAIAKSTSSGAKAGKRSRTKAQRKFVPLRIFRPGDYVVHQTHGIGRYEGIQKLSVDKVTKDYLKISYQGTDCLYVPVDQLDLLYKYIGGTDKAVHVNKLGGADWNKQKNASKVDGRPC